MNDINMWMNLLVIILVFLSMTLLYGWFRYIRLCMEISTRNKIDFQKAKKMLEEGNLSDSQVSKIYKWADTIESKKHAWCLVLAVSELYQEMKAGKIPYVEPDQEKDYTDDLARLFTYWMFAQAYSIFLTAPLVRECLLYVVSAKETDRSIDIEVNKDVFKQDMAYPMAA